jgi:hypothetical protein
MNHIKRCCSDYRYNLHDFINNVSKCSLFSSFKLDPLFGSHNLLNLFACAPFLLQLLKVGICAFQGRLTV